MAQGSPINILACPKCGAQMRAYERNGVTVDQCVECRGVFLDRGELEHLMGAERKYYNDGWYDDDWKRSKPKKKKKMSSFLEGLFEGGD
jgi:Zn-finger nucleic acid-binding protein